MSNPDLVEVMRAMSAKEWAKVERLRQRLKAAEDTAKLLDAQVKAVERQ